MKYWLIVSLFEFVDTLQNCSQRENRTSSTIQCRNNYLDTGKHIQTWYLFVNASLYRMPLFHELSLLFWQDDLEQALTAIRKGTPVQKAAAEFGIPSGTLYGRCKKVGIELSKTTAVHWSEEAMKQALVSVRSGE